MWYGFFKNNWNFKRKKSNSTDWSMKTYKKSNSFIRLPSNWNFIILKNAENRIVYSFNNFYYVNIPLPKFKSSCHVNKSTNSIHFYYKFSPYCHYSLLKHINELISLSSRPFFKKITFKGKGYYIYKNSKNTIAPKFGYSHRVYTYSKRNLVKFLSKTKIFVFGLSSKDINLTSFSIKNHKPINIFTGRGVRFAKQIIYRKTGKVSSYR